MTSFEVNWGWVAGAVGMLTALVGIGLAVHYWRSGQKAGKVIGKLATLHRAAVRKKVDGELAKAEADAQDDVMAADAEAAEEVSRETSGSLVGVMRILDDGAGSNDSG